MQSGSKIAGIETMRVLAILAIIAGHTTSYYNLEILTPSGRLALRLAEQLCLVAVPFFFIAAGYFYSRALDGGREPVALFLRYGKRLGVALVVWHILSAFIPYDWPDALQQSNLVGAVALHARERIWEAATDPVAYLFRYHLWFLLALMLGLFVLSVIPPRRRAFLLPMAATGYVAACAIQITLFQKLAGGLLFPLIGAWLAGRKPPTRAQAWTLFFGGYLLQTGEAILMRNVLAAPPTTWMFFVGTVPFGIGAFLIGLTHPSFGQRQISKLGRFTLGIYCAHWLIINSLSPVRSQILGLPLVGLFVFPLLVYILSFLSVWAAAHWRIAARLPWTHLVGQRARELRHNESEASVRIGWQPRRLRRRHCVPMYLRSHSHDVKNQAGTESAS